MNTQIYYETKAKLNKAISEANKILADDLEKVASEEELSEESMDEYVAKEVEVQERLGIYTMTQELQKMEIEIIREFKSKLEAEADNTELRTIFDSWDDLVVSTNVLIRRRLLDLALRYI